MRHWLYYHHGSSQVLPATKTLNNWGGHTHSYHLGLHCKTSENLCLFNDVAHYDDRLIPFILTTQTEIKVQTNINTVYAGWAGDIHNVANANNGQLFAFVYTNYHTYGPWCDVSASIVPLYRAYWKTDSTKSIISNNDYLITSTSSENVDFEDCSSVSFTMTANPNKMADGGWFMHTDVDSHSVE
jgi:hypothetical protein